MDKKVRTCPGILRREPRLASDEPSARSEDDAVAAALRRGRATPPKAIRNNRIPSENSRTGSKQRRIIIGITGGFGSGKTTVAKIFASYGGRPKLIDADKIAHKVIRRQTAAYKKICAVFGRGILRQNKDIDRGRLAKIVFNNKDLLKELNNIVHPEVIKNIKNQIKASKAKIIILDAPLLIEAGLRYIVDKLIVVDTQRKTAIQRIQKKTFLQKGQIQKRAKSQLSLFKKRRLADFIIDNNGTIKETKKQVEEILRKL